MSIFTVAEESIKSDISKRKALQEELSSTTQTPEAKALSEEFNRIREEMAKLKGENDEMFAKRGELKTQRDELQKARDKAYEHKKMVQDEYFKQRDAYRAWNEQNRKVPSTPLIQGVDCRLKVRSFGNNGKRRNVDGLNIILLFDLKKPLKMHLLVKSGNARMYPHLKTVLILVTSIVWWK